MSKFSWGRVIETFEYDFDGEKMEVTKFHPWKVDNGRILTGIPDETEIYYHCDELSESVESLHYLLIAWIARKNLGLNHGALVHGIAKALDVYGA